MLWPCIHLSICPSVASRSSIKTVKRIELVSWYMRLDPRLILLYCGVMRECRAAERGDGTGVHAVGGGVGVRSLPARRVPHKRREVHAAAVRIRLPARLVLHQRSVESPIYPCPSLQRFSSNNDTLTCVIHTAVAAQPRVQG